MTVKTSQEKRVLAHLMRGKPITPLQALNKYGIFRLGARIYDLKKQGFQIETNMVHQKGKRFASYKLAA